jgi:hypothetical protein
MVFATDPPAVPIAATQGSMFGIQQSRVLLWVVDFLSVMSIGIATTAGAAVVP